MRETYTNIEEAISGFGLDFTVEKTPLYTNINGILQQYDDKVATYRTDNELTLGTVGESYEIVQNIDQFGVFQQFADEGVIPLRMVEYSVVVAELTYRQFSHQQLTSILIGWMSRRSISQSSVHMMVRFPYRLSYHPTESSVGTPLCLLSKLVRIRPKSSTQRVLQKN